MLRIEGNSGGLGIVLVVVYCKCLYTVKGGENRFPIAGAHQAGTSPPPQTCELLVNT